MGYTLVLCAGMTLLHQLARLIIYEFCDQGWPTYYTSLFAYLLWSYLFQAFPFNLRRVHLRVTHGKTSWYYGRVLIVCACYLRYCVSVCTNFSVNKHYPILIGLRFYCCSNLEYKRCCIWLRLLCLHGRGFCSVGSCEHSNAKY